MSDGLFMKLSLILAGTLLAGTGCTSASNGTDSADEASLHTAEASLDEEAGSITFDADGAVNVSGALEKGKKIRVTYDPNRLTVCRGDINGGPGWAISGFWMIGGGAVHSFEAGGLSPSGGTSQPILTLDAPGDLQLWFQNTSRWGCNAYDSNLGNNYHFNVKASANDPDWVGNARVIVSRQTCNGPCESDMRTLDSEVLYDTWTRQRAAIRAIYFEAWKDGVTNFDNPDLWKQLDVQVHSRAGGAGAFTTAYVGFDRRSGNNARYALDLRTLDPLDPPGAIKSAADCPAFPVTAALDPRYVEVVVELYFTVNGVELRPIPGAAYRVRYQNYASSYALCVK